jgi:hypothetical protein
MSWISNALKIVGVVAAVVAAIPSCGASLVLVAGIAAAALPVAASMIENDETKKDIAQTNDANAKDRATKKTAQVQADLIRQQFEQYSASGQSGLRVLSLMS